MEFSFWNYFTYFEISLNVAFLNTAGEISAKNCFIPFVGNFEAKSD
jgi:hypothetical protein